MKKALIIVFAISTLLSCNKEGEILKGKFVYFDGAAVLQTEDEIYGVFVTDKMLELNKKAEPFKKEPTDMVQVEIRAKVSTEKDDKILWDNKVKIVEILNVSAPNQEDNVVKLAE